MVQSQSQKCTQWTNALKPQKNLFTTAEANVFIKTHNALIARVENIPIRHNGGANLNEKVYTTEEID